MGKQEGLVPTTSNSPLPVLHTHQCYQTGALSCQTPTFLSTLWTPMGKLLSDCGLAYFWGSQLFQNDLLLLPPPSPSPHLAFKIFLVLADLFLAICMVPTLFSCALSKIIVSVFHLFLEGLVILWFPANSAPWQTPESQDSVDHLSFSHRSSVFCCFVFVCGFFAALVTSSQQRLWSGSCPKCTTRHSCDVQEII